ncbi:MAG: hypothetical protein H6658_03285 [Ardenticatenaceae bacterium]|nr:hypothetical protein [Ardenticatenaceae bacterium]
MLEYIDSTTHPLTEEQATKFRNLHNTLREIHREGNLLLLYRGEKYDNLTRKLFKNQDDSDAEELYRRIFFYGDKAKHFFLNPPNTSEARDYLRHVNDISVNTFRYIFERINQVINAPRRNLRNNTNEYSSTRFRDYFQNNHNQLIFLDTISDKDESIKLKVRDYYLFFLHVAGYTGLENDSLFVSTSTERRIARDFTRRVQDSGRLIYHYYIPRPYNKHAVAP